MKYSSQYVRSLSFEQWTRLMAKELNEKGYRMKGGSYNGYQPIPYRGDDPQSFLLGEVGKNPEIDYLKSIGLLNNGRCPDCGKSIYNNPGRFTSGFDPDVHFQICQDCVNRGKGYSMNPANNSGCIVALLLIPFSFTKLLFQNIVNFFV